MKLSEKASRQCVFAITGKKISGFYRFERGFYGHVDTPTIFQDEIDQTLEYRTPAWLDDIIVVTSKHDHERKFFGVLSKLKKADCRASKRKSENFLKQTTWLGHEIDENGIKPNKEKVEATLKLKLPNKANEFKSFLDAIRYLAKFLPEPSENTGRLRNLLKKARGRGPRKKLERIKQKLTQIPYLAHYAKDKDNFVTTEAGKTGLGNTLWQKQNNGEIKLVACGSRYLNDTEKTYSLGELELLAVVCGLEKFYLLSLREESTFVHRSLSIGTAKKMKPE